MDYSDVYKARVNRYGLNYQSRVQNMREKSFEDYLIKSVYRVDFKHEDIWQPASFEPLKQTDAKTLHYLLTRVDLNMDAGTVLMLPNKDEVFEPWMIIYLEDYKASGYNRYLTVKLKNMVEINGVSTPVCFYGPGERFMRDTIKSRGGFSSGGGAIYLEDQNNYLMIMPFNPDIKKDLYLEIGEGAMKQPFRVMGYDIQTDPGVEYVTLEIVYEYDKSEEPLQYPTDDESDWFWLNGR